MKNWVKNPDPDLGSGSVLRSIWIRNIVNKSVFRIRPDQKLFGLKDPDPKLLIFDPDPDPAPDPDPPLFHTKL